MEGATLGLVARSADRLEEAASLARAKGAEVLTSPGDVADNELAKRVARTMIERFGRIDILVNNAGTNTYHRNLADMSVADWNQVFSTNLTGAFLFTRHVLPHMRKAGKGQIINISSGAGLAPLGSSIAYAVSKAGLIHLTRCVAVALGPEVAVNAVAPGTMLGTRMTARLDPALIERTTKNAALQKPVERDDVAHQILAFCRSDSTTGQVLVLDSGVVYH
jgi:3-oxoacyl-[acyl-carrier protein] reductase